MRAAVFALLLAAAPAAASPYEDYALGRLAAADNDLPAAERRFDRALAADPRNAMLRRRAFDLALLAGDARGAERLAAALPVGEGEDGTPALLRLCTAFAARDWTRADRAAQAFAALKLGDAPALIARAWTMFAREQRDAALALLDPRTAPAGASALVGEQRARMLAAMGRWAEARAAYTGLVAGGGGALDTLVQGANAAARAGDAAAARDFLTGRESGALEIARARLAAGKPILADPGGPQEGLSATIVQIAAEFDRGGAAQPALAYARLATFCAPQSAERRLLLAELLLRAKQPAAAWEALAPIQADGLWAGEADRARARVLIAQDRRPDAEALLVRAANRPDAGVFAWTLLGEYHAEAKQPARAAAAFDRALALASANGGTPTWTRWFERGTAYEQAGDWAKAEPDLRQALALAPREPIVLNYLGYSLVDRGLKLDEATGMLQRALKLAPQSPAILDSVGWAYYRQARYPEAIGPLERAAAAEPGDAAIAEHLGDGYWAVGRRLEARFRWNAAATLGPEPAAKVRLATKIDYGGDVRPPPGA